MQEDVGGVGSIPGSERSPGRRNGNPLQYSCLVNPMYRGTWQAIVHRVSKSWTWLSDWAHTHTRSTSDVKSIRSEILRVLSQAKGGVRKGKSPVRWKRAKLILYTWDCFCGWHRPRLTVHSGLLKMSKCFPMRLIISSLFAKVSLFGWYILWLFYLYVLFLLVWILSEDR